MAFLADSRLLVLDLESALTQTLRPQPQSLRDLIDKLSRRESNWSPDTAGNVAYLLVRLLKRLASYGAISAWFTPAGVRW